MEHGIDIRSVRRIAGDVRGLCERFALSPESHGYDFHGHGSTLTCMCAVASAVLVEELRASGIDAQFIAGSYDIGDGSSEENHCWVELGDGSVVDITLTQFGKCPGVVLGSYEELEKLGHHYGIRRRLGNSYGHLNWRVPTQEPTGHLLSVIDSFR
jgi:hypothetical protein